jgi:signal recognition particle GTPase
MNLTQVQFLSSFPPFYFEAGAGILLLAIVLWLLFFKVVRRQELAPKDDSAVPENQIDAPKRNLKSILSKTSEAFTSKLDALILSTKKFDEKFIENLEELLYTSDLGPKTVESLLIRAREKLSRGELSDLKTVF